MRHEWLKDQHEYNDRHCEGETLFLLFLLSFSLFLFLHTKKFTKKEKL